MLASAGILGKRSTLPACDVVLVGYDGRAARKESGTCRRGQNVWAFA